MTKGPINPVECSQNAIRAGLLIPSDVAQRVNPDFTVGHHSFVPRPPPKRGSADFFLAMLIESAAADKIKTPEEAGIAKIKPTPPAPSSKLLLRKKGNGGNKKWIITRKQRPDLFT